MAFVGSSGWSISFATLRLAENLMFSVVKCSDWKSRDGSVRSGHSIAHKNKQKSRSEIGGPILVSQNSQKR